MLFVSNSQTPGTREIPSVHLITIEQGVPIRTLYLQGMFLPKPEEAESYSSEHSNYSQTWHGPLYLGDDCMDGILMHGITFPTDSRK